MLRCSSKLRTSTVRPNMALRQLSSHKVNHGGLLSVDQIQPEKNGAVRFGSSYKVPDHHMPGAGLEPLVGTMEAMDGNTAAVHVACKSLIWSVFLNFICEMFATTTFKKKRKRSFFKLSTIAHVFDSSDRLCPLVFFSLLFPFDSCPCHLHRHWLVCFLPFF